MPETILHRALTRHMLLWEIREGDVLTGAAATSDHTDNQGRFAMLDAFAGDGWHRWGSEILNEFERRAQRAGMTRIRGGGRPGWIRELKRYGYLPVPGTAVFEKRLSDG